MPWPGFYSPVTRFWELMIGSALAALSLKQPLPAKGASMRAAAGAALIGIGWVVLNQKRLFPGWWALLPTVVRR
jgi:peptidoglycan/LPS O-acetylase OafA/YrhL